MYIVRCVQEDWHVISPSSYLAVHSIIFTLQQTNQKSLVHQNQYQPSWINYFLQSQLYNESLWELAQLKKKKLSHQQDEGRCCSRPVLFPPLSTIKLFRLVFRKWNLTSKDELYFKQSWFSDHWGRKVIFNSYITKPNIPWSSLFFIQNKVFEKKF